MSIKFNEQSLPTDISVCEIETTILPSIEISDINVNRTVGKYVLSKKLGSKIFNVKFYISATDRSDLYSKYRILAQWLYTEEPVKFEILADTNYYYLAVASDTDIREIHSQFAEVNVKFYCSNPLAYNTATQTADTLTEYTTTTITNNGNFKSYPVIEAEVINDSTFLYIENKTNEQQFLIGSEVIYGEGGAVGYQTQNVIDESAGLCNDLTKWTNDASDFDFGQYASNFKLTTTTIGGSSQTGLEATSYDSVAGEWTGSHAYHDLTTQIDNFSITFDVQYEGVENSDGTGCAEMYVINADGYRIFKFSLQSMSWDNPVLWFKIYDGTINENILYTGTTGTTNISSVNEQKNRPRGYYYAPTNILRCRVAKRSQDWTIWIGKFEENDDSFSRVVAQDTFKWTDSGDLLTGVGNYVDRVVITASKYDTTTAPTKLIIHTVEMIEELADQNGVPYILKNGDKILISSKEGLIYRNGELFYDYLDLISDFITLEKGDNSIFISGSAGSLQNCQITKNETYF